MIFCEQLKQRRCPECEGSGLVSRRERLIKCPTCGKCKKTSSSPERSTTPTYLFLIVTTPLPLQNNRWLAPIPVLETVLAPRKIKCFQKKSGKNNRLVQPFANKHKERIDLPPALQPYPRAKYHTTQLTHPLKSRQLLSLQSICFPHHSFPFTTGKKEKPKCSE